MNEGKFLALWTKYLPAIRILLKKAVTEKQQITLSKMELQSIDNRKNVPQMGKDLYSVLNGDSLVRKFMLDKKINIQMSRASLLTFTCNSPVSS